MVYVDGSGAVRDQRPIWTPRGLYQFFLSFINFVVLLFRSLIDPTLTKNGTSTQSNHYRSGGGGGGSGGGGGGRFDGPPRAPRRRMGGFGGAGGGPSCPPMAGG